MKVIKVSSITCTSCLVMDKVFNKIKDSYHFEYQELDFDFDYDEVIKYNPGKILPVYIFLENDKEIGRITGEKKENDFLNEIKNIVGEEV